MGNSLHWLPFPIPITIAAAEVALAAWALRRWSARTDLQALAVCTGALVVQMAAGFAVLGADRPRQHHRQGRPQHHRRRPAGMVRAAATPCHATRPVPSRTTACNQPRPAGQRNKRVTGERNDRGKPKLAHARCVHEELSEPTLAIPFRNAGISPTCWTAKARDTSPARLHQPDPGRRQAGPRPG